MPTGLTEKLNRGEDTSLRGFVLGCVTQMGAGYFATRQGTDKMPLDKAPVLEVNNYYQKYIDDSEKELSELIALKGNMEEATRLYNEEMEKHKKENEEYKKKCEEVRERYLNMLHRVENFDLPDEYASLKNLMIKQIKDSLDFDCVGGELYDTTPIPVSEWLQNRIDCEIRSHQYWQGAFEKEKERVAEGNRYLQGLYEALDRVEPLDKVEPLC